MIFQRAASPVSYTHLDVYKRQAHTVAVKGPKGSLNSNYHPLMTVKVEGNEVLVTRPNDEPQARSLHGLTRTNIANMVNGVVNGYEKKLEIVGVGLRCQKQGSNQMCIRDRHRRQEVHLQGRYRRYQGRDRSGCRDPVPRR